MTSFYIVSSAQDLEHHGIKGMKWGVRRFQNYDGSYTKKGLKRYRQSEAEYDAAKADYDKAKAHGDMGGSERARMKVREAKRKMSKDYDQLKRDKKADEGKKLYAQGKTITDIGQMAGYVNTGISLLTAAGMAYASKNGLKLNTKYGDVPVRNLVAAAGITASAVTTAKAYVDSAKLRAYYAHGRG